MDNVERLPRNRRIRNFWEPIFDPNQKDAFPTTVLDDTHHSGLTSCTFLSRCLPKLCADKTFKRCDFEGEFKDHRFVFKDCNFELCDFGLSTWRNAKFSNCKFDHCSFTQTNFDTCEFRACSWTKIGLSGNETRLKDTIITNPGSFISAAYTNLDTDVLKQNSTTSVHQMARLAETKAILARVLLLNLGKSGEETSYYDAIKTYSLQTLEAKKLHFRYERSKSSSLKKPFWVIQEWIVISEYLLILIFGYINNWGSSLAKPLAFGVAISFLYAAIYRHLGFQHSWPDALITSIDVTVVAGYTKYTADTALSKWLLFSNMIFGLCWYIVVVPTIINRISRVR